MKSRRDGYTWPRNKTFIHNPFLDVMGYLRPLKVIYDKKRTSRRRSRASATFQHAHAHANRPGTLMRRDTNEKKAERGNARANEKKTKQKRKKK